MVTIGDLREDVLMVLLSYIPARELVLTCRLVCRAWKELIDKVHIWKRMCIRDGYFKKDWDILPEDWKKLYFFRPFQRNLLKNPCAEEDFQYWTIDINGGDRWKIEDLPESHSANFPNKDINKYFVTSYGLCRKSQIIDLVENGLWSHLLDKTQPSIVIKDWYAARYDCGCIYKLRVSLLSETKSVIDKFESKKIRIPQWSDANWNEIVHVFKDYGPGVRYIQFSHEGKDTQFWAGWYGIRVTSSSVTIEP